MLQGEAGSPVDLGYPLAIGFLKKHHFPPVEGHALQVLDHPTHCLQQQPAKGKTSWEDGDDICFLPPAAPQTSGSKVLLQ